MSWNQRQERQNAATSSSSSSNSLAVGLVAAVGSLGKSLRGLSRVGRLLCDHGDATLLVGNDTDGLITGNLAFGISRMNFRHPGRGLPWR